MKRPWSNRSKGQGDTGVTQIDMGDVAKAFGDIAEALSAYYAVLTKQGFTEVQAMQLVAAYQTQVLAAGMVEK